jgi:hypothetical protein
MNEKSQIRFDVDYGHVVAKPFEVNLTTTYLEKKKPKKKEKIKEKRDVNFKKYLPKLEKVFLTFCVASLFWFLLRL